MMVSCWFFSRRFALDEDDYRDRLSIAQPTPQAGHAPAAPGSRGRRSLDMRRGRLSDGGNGRALPMATNDPRFVEVYRPRTAGKAHLIKNLLEEEGFTVLVENEYLQGVSGEIPGGWATCPRILVE